MTAQASDNLRNDNPRVDFDTLRCYGLTRSAPTETSKWSGVLGGVFDFPRPPRQRPDTYCTACYRGYIASYVLNPDGALTLAAYEYTTLDVSVGGTASLRIDEDPVSEPITGDFWLILRPHFFTDPTTFVPFRNGRVIEDRSQWVTLPNTEAPT
jgi:hypothetical protein